MAEEKVKEVKPIRPGGPKGARGPMPKVENPRLIFKRLFGKFRKNRGCYA